MIKILIGFAVASAGLFQINENPLYGAASLVLGGFLVMEGISHRS